MSAAMTSRMRSFTWLIAGAAAGYDFAKLRSCDTMEITICVPACVAGDGDAGDGDTAVGDVGACGAEPSAPGGGGMDGEEAIHGFLCPYTFLCACLCAFLNDGCTALSPDMSVFRFSLRREPPSFARLPIRPPRLDLLPYPAIEIFSCADEREGGRVLRAVPQSG